MMLIHKVSFVDIGFRRNLIRKSDLDRMIDNLPLKTTTKEELPPDETDDLFPAAEADDAPRETITARIERLTRERQ